MPYQLGLLNMLNKFDLNVDVVNGWGTRGSSRLDPRVSTNHWTATSSMSDRPSLNVEINGRPGIPGPLCNVLLARSGTAVVVAAGVANHAGLGSWKGYSGNSRTFGTECEGTIGKKRGTDFTDAQFEAYPKIIAVYHTLIGNDPAAFACGHSEWAPRRKIDIGQVAINEIRAEASRLWRRGGADKPAPVIEEEEDDMALTIIIPTGIPAGRSAYPIAHDGNRIWGVTNPGAWLAGGLAKQAAVPFADWEAVVHAYGGAEAVDIVGDGMGDR